MNTLKVIRYFLLVFLILPSLLFSEKVDKQKVLDETFLPLVSGQDSAKSIKSLKKDIDRILRNGKLKKTKYAVGVYSLTNNTLLYEKDIDKVLTPASVTKLYTSFAVINTFGTNYQIPTTVYTDGFMLNDSVLNGNIYIYGRGDCLLKSADIDNLSTQLIAQGIRTINGNVYGDGSFFDGVNSRFKYSHDNDRVQAIGPITALGIEKNQVTVLIKAGSKGGAYLDVQLIPNSEAFVKKVTGKVKGRSKKKSSNDAVSPSLEVQRFGDEPVDLAMMAKRRRSTVRISTKAQKSGKQSITVSGYLNAKKSRSYRHYMTNPELVVAGVLKNTLQLNGITVTGHIGIKKIFDNTGKITKLAEFHRPITELMYTMNKESNNFIAEHMMKMVGAQKSFYSDVNLKAYNSVLFGALDSMKIDCQGCMLNDGSGLSRRNKVTAASTIGILKSLYLSAYFNDFDSTLSIAGHDGTLEKRMYLSAADGTLRGKTGTLRNVSGLAGYVTTLDNEVLAFAMFFNGNDPGRYKTIENEIGETLALFFYFNEEY